MGHYVIEDPEFLHQIMGLDPEEYDRQMEAGRKTPGWEGMEATLDPRMHRHPLLGNLVHSHSSVEDARRVHGHYPRISWDTDPVFVADLPFRQVHHIDGDG